MSVTQILDHSGDALKRLLEQYKNQEVLQGVIDIYSDQVQEAENALYALFDALDPNDMEGAMLDIIGAIVGRPRSTTDDVRYRILIWVKVHQNVSKGEPERVISVLKLLTESVYVHNISLGQAEVQLQMTNQLLSQDEIDLIYREIHNVTADGVRVSYIIHAHPEEAFAYAGINGAAPALGYDDGSGTTGGKYATQTLWKVPFAYAGTEEGAEGYGAGGADPLAGGVYVA